MNPAVTRRAFLRWAAAPAVFGLAACAAPAAPTPQEVRTAALAATAAASSAASAGSVAPTSSGLAVPASNSVPAASTLSRAYSPAGATLVVPSPTATLVPPKPTVTPTPRPPTPTPIVRARPRYIEISKIGVQASVVDIKVLPSGELGAPEGPTDVGWFVGGPKPGEPGNAVLTGHLDWRGPPPRPAVFWRLRELEVGDPIVIDTDDKNRLTFKVESTTLFERDNAPVERILGFVVGQVITVISCEGTFLPVERDYTQRRIVRARLA